MWKNVNVETITVATSVLAQLVRYLSNHEVDTDKLFISQDVDPDILTKPDTRLSAKTYIAIEDEAARLINDPYFGLHMGEFIEPGNWSILGYMMMNCKTLGDAFEKSSRYSKLIGNWIHSRFEIGIKKVKVILYTPKNTPKHSRHCFESVFSSTICISRTLTGKSINPVEVGFTASAPESQIEYIRVFQ